MTIKIEYLVSDLLWEANLLKLKRIANKAIRIAAAELNVTNAVLTINLSNDAELHALNKQFMNKDKPTNVLSFPSDEEDYLGDIAVSYQTIERESREQNKTFRNHFTHMIVHSFLHLLGFDHMNEIDAEEMESMECTILQKLKISDPYADYEA